MQFNTVALVLAAMASVAYAEKTVTVYACEATSTAPVGVATPTGGVPSVPVVPGSATSIASTGVVTVPSPTGSPIVPATGAASVNGVSGSALGLIVAGGVALLF